MSVTIKDVAKEAGVSVASVSRVVNGLGGVTPEVRERIQGIVKRMRFTPSGAARSMVMKRTDTIGALLPDMHGEYFSELIRGIDAGARARGLHLLVSSSHGSQEEAEAAINAMRGRVDGLLVMSAHLSADFLTRHLPAGLPVVVLNAPAQGGRFAGFQIDNFGGAQALTRHLMAQGHRHIAFIAGPIDNLEAEERLRGYRSALSEAAGVAQQFILQGDFSEDSGARAAQQILASGQRPSAVFAANDMMAIGCLAALQQAGLNVPQDIAVAGFDDIPIARYVTPPLTTVHVPIVELGALATQELAAAIEQPGKPHSAAQMLPTELVIRQSCRFSKP